MFHVHFPSGNLYPYIDSIVYSEYDPEHSVERLIPDGTVNLIMELGDEPQHTFNNQDLSVKETFKGGWISGIQQEYITISAKNTKGMVVVRFKPAGSYSVLHLPVDEIRNHVIDAELILGREISRLREKIQQQVSVNQKILTIERWLRDRINDQTVPEAVIHYAVSQAQMNPSMITIKQIIDRCGYSHRHLIQLFKKHVGIAPKPYHRILRFNKVLEKINANVPLDWANLSAQCGYYDQAHFIKEFKQFSGFSPGSFLQERGEFINYVPLH